MMSFALRFFVALFSLVARPFAQDAVILRTWSPAVLDPYLEKGARLGRRPLHRRAGGAKEPDYGTQAATTSKGQTLGQRAVFEAFCRADS